MKDSKLFTKIEQKTASKRNIEERVNDWQEILIPLTDNEIKDQASRCMDCGVPFCHSAGCPLTNIIPYWNEMIYLGQWKQALALLEKTSPFPEITGRVCPALCEAACTLSVNKEAVTIRQIELALVEKGFEEGWIRPQPLKNRTNKKVAIIGSGPAGLAAAKKLNDLGHRVVVYEKNDRIGGLLRYGIPDFKLEKKIIDRRLEIMQIDGITFETSINVGEDISVNYLTKHYDAILLSGGAEAPRKLNILGEDLKGVYYAMDFLTQQNRINAGDQIDPDKIINVKDKVVVVIGGGDTGNDCVGSANRLGAKSVYQFELLPQPPLDRSENDPWPSYPRIYRKSTSHEEGCEQHWNILTKEFKGDKNGLKKISAAEIKWLEPDASGRATFEEIAGKNFEINADIAILATGFTGPVKNELLNELGVEFDNRGNVKTDPLTQMTSVNGVFCSGDMTKGPSLVVWAIQSSAKAAEAIHNYLMNS